MRNKSRKDPDKAAREEFQRGENKKSFHVKDLTSIQPKSQAQRDLFEAWNTYDHLVLNGSAGCGKTFLAMYLGLREVLNEDTNQDKLIIVRTAVPVRNVGFMPGDLKSKSEVYELPYISICNELFPYSRSYENLKKNHYVDFILTSYIRGITLDNAIIVFDEAASASFHELDSVITRLGQNSRIIFCGDVAQSDLGRKQGFTDFLKITSGIDEIAEIKFLPEDIVRSGIVRDYIIQKAAEGL